MSDTIDYDEIDKAVHEAQAAAAAKRHKANAKSSAASPRPQTVSVKNTTHPASAPRPAHRSMDFTKANNIHVSTPEDNAERLAKIRAHQAQLRAAARAKAQQEAILKARQEQAKKQAALRARQIEAAKKAGAIQEKPSTAAMPHYHSAPIQNTASPRVNAELQKQQILERKQRQARLEHLKQQQAKIKAAQAKARAEIRENRAAKQNAPAANDDAKLNEIFQQNGQLTEDVFESFDEISTDNPLINDRESSRLAHAAAAAKDSLTGRGKAKEPNANNYSLGVRSPFIVNTKVEKRPLGPESNNGIRSTKNLYSQKDPSKTKEDEAEEHLIIDEPNRSSGWVWPFIVIFVIIAGGALGYFAYRIVFAN